MTPFLCSCWALVTQLTVWQTDRDRQTQDQATTSVLIGVSVQCMLGGLIIILLCNYNKTLLQHSSYSKWATSADAYVPVAWVPDYRRRLYDTTEFSTRLNGAGNRGITAGPWDALSVEILSDCCTAVSFLLLAVLDSRVCYTMDFKSPFKSLCCHSAWLFHGELCPRIHVVHPGRVWYSSPACTWHSSLHYFFLQATCIWYCFFMVNVGPIWPQFASFFGLTMSNSPLFSLALLRTNLFVFFTVHENSALLSQRRQDVMWFFHSFYVSSFHSRTLLQATLALSLVYLRWNRYAVTFPYFLLRQLTVLILSPIINELVISVNLNFRLHTWRVLNERTNERSLFSNEHSEQWQVTSKGRSPSKLATKKNKKRQE